MNSAIRTKLEQRLGSLHAKQRLGIETDHEAQIFGQGINFFHIENWYSVHSLIRYLLKLSGLYWRGRRNAERIQVRHNLVRSQKLPFAFNGFTLLRISDLHIDLNESAMSRLEELVINLDYELCAMTGDYRGATFGPYGFALEGMKRLRSRLRAPTYGVLGNHDTICMVPGLEEMGIRMLLNECEPILLGSDRIYLAGIDDAHYYRVDNIGSIPITLSSVLPRHMGSGAWTYYHMAGYTSGGSSVVPVRINCLPEITLHHLNRSQVLSTRAART
jgi:predicted MPP superfamily phosphohydrolase